MLLKNMGEDQPELVNGSIGTVVVMRPKKVLVDFGDLGDVEWIEPAVFEIRDDDRKLVATRTQLPLMLAWAMSGHKCQGLTITSNVVADLGSVFEEGQAYVMLSRVKKLEQLSLTAFNPKTIRANAAVVAWYQDLRK
jgi:ATP-dependent DNA helicase PIF1